MINNKYKSYNILYYILILIRSILILLKYIYISISIYNIYIYLLLIYINNIYYIFNNLNHNNIIININYIYFYIYKYFLLNYKNKNIIKLLNKNIIEKIIEIKKISYTIKKGRIKRYKILLLIGNKCGWIGVGIGKHINIDKAIIKAKLNALYNIYYFKYSLLYIYKIKFMYFNINKMFIKLQINIFNIMNIKFLILKYLLECLGYLNYKIIICHSILKNKIHILNNLLLLLFKSL